jgi:hypothetical protein
VVVPRFTINRPRVGYQALYSGQGYALLVSAWLVQTVLLHHETSIRSRRKEMFVKTGRPLELLVSVTVAVQCNFH